MPETKSTNARPKTHALTDDTLRRTGVRDLSELNEHEASGMRPPPPNPRMDIFLPQVGGDGVFPFRDWELHAGPPPEKIDRIHYARNRGMVGKNINGQERPDARFNVGHVPLYHPNRPISGNPSVATSDATYIPSVRIGQPL